MLKKTFYPKVFNLYVKNFLLIISCMVVRKEFMKILWNWKDKKVIKVVTGVRRCGKSTLLSQFKSEVEKLGECNTISINFDDLENEFLCDYHVLYKHLRGKITAGQMNYVFLDEIQLVPQFEKVVNSLFLKDNVDIYITGSNAYMLSGEIATLLSGRYVEIKMLPFSFAEYAQFKSDFLKKEVAADETLYNEYVSVGGFPYVASISTDKNLVRDYIRGIYSTIVLKDIIQRKKLSDSDVLEKVCKFTLSNVGNLVSSKKVSDTLTSGGRKTSPATVENCYSALTESYLFYKATRYDIKGKEFLKSLEKYYAVDMGLRFFMLGIRTGDDGFILENVVYLELLRRGYEVYVGKYNDLEIDFVAKKDGLTEYYQVALSVREQSTLERELRPFRLMKDNYPKLLITLDNSNNIDHNGIIQIYAVKWLASA